MTRYFERGPARPISQGFPFNNHRTMARVIADERGETKVPPVPLQFTPTSFIHHNEAKGAEG